MRPLLLVVVGVVGSDREISGYGAFLYAKGLADARAFGRISDDLLVSVLPRLFSPVPVS